MNVDDFNTLKIACEGLEKANIPYMLTGSFAANFYAVPRMTRDIDIIIQILNQIWISTEFELLQEAT